MYGLARPFLFGLDAERAHSLTLDALEAAYRTGLNPLVARKPQPLPTKAFGLTFPNPVGLAAGLDKNGAHIDALLSLGFGFIEIGTVTPKPQAGNPKPRMFRLPEHRAVINRLGFNNDGIEALVRNVERAQATRRPARHQYRQEQGHAQRSGRRRLHVLPVARVPAGRLHHRQHLLAQYRGPARTAGRTGAAPPGRHPARGAGTPGAKHGKRVPMLVKVAPDLNESDVDAAARVLTDCGVDGVIATNTTVSRMLVQGAQTCRRKPAACRASH